MLLHEVVCSQHRVTRTGWQLRTCTEFCCGDREIHCPQETVKEPRSPVSVSSAENPIGRTPRQSLHLPFYCPSCGLWAGQLMSSWHELELSWKREPQLRRCPLDWPVSAPVEHFLDWGLMGKNPLTVDGAARGLCA